MILIAVFLGGCAREKPPDSRRTKVVEAVEDALPSVVNIGTERIVRTVYQDQVQRSRGSLREESFSDFFGLPPPSNYQLAHSLGSGIVIHRDGYVLTNYHVIEKASAIYVTLTDGVNRRAEVVGGDPVSDLSLLKVDVDEPLDPIEFAGGDDLMLGENVIVLGNPYGLSQSVTVGVLSSKNREARHNGEVIFKDILQTDAAVNPGSSGGPMLNIEGKLIGVNIAIYKDAQNIGFAVPVNRVRRLLEHWLSPEFLMKKSLGLRVASAEDGDGVEVTEVYTNSPAAKGNLEVGDIITSIDGERIGSELEYAKELVSNATRDEAVHLGVKGWMGIRETVLDWQALPQPSGKALARERLGLEFESSLSEEQRVYGRGLVVSNVLEDSPADKAGLYEGLFLVAVNGEAVQSLDALADLLENVDSGEKLDLTLVRVTERGPFRLAQQIGVEVTAE